MTGARWDAHLSARRHPIASGRRATRSLCVVAMMLVPLVGHAQRRPSRTTAPTDTAPATSPIKAGWLVRPDTVAVGDPFTFVVSVEVPMDAAVQWPVITDTAAMVAMRSPAKVTSVPNGALRRETAEYSLAAWNVGRVPLGLPDITVRTTSGVINVPLRDARMFVRTVLPGDTSLHVPKPARSLFPRVVPWWERWWPAAAVVAALLLLWWLFKRKKHPKPKRVAAPLDVFARAMHDFERLQRLALVDVGERGRAVALAVEIVRTYLSARVPRAELSRTSAELLVTVSDDARIPRDRLASLLAEADSIKFAQRSVSGSHARELQDEARAVVEAIEENERARRKADDDARKEIEREQRALKEADEDEARRRSRRAKAGAA